MLRLPVLSSLFLSSSLACSHHILTTPRSQVTHSGQRRVNQWIRREGGERRIVECSGWLTGWRMALVSNTNSGLPSTWSLTLLLPSPGQSVLSKSRSLFPWIQSKAAYSFTKSWLSSKRSSCFLAVRFLKTRASHPSVWVILRGYWWQSSQTTPLQSRSGRQIIYRIT